MLLREIFRCRGLPLLARGSSHASGVRFSGIHQPPVARCALRSPGANFLHASGVKTSSPEGLLGH